MPRKNITLRGDDAVEFDEFRDRLDEHVPGGVESDAQTLRAAVDLAGEQLDGGRE